MTTKNAKNAQSVDNATEIRAKAEPTALQLAVFELENHPPSSVSDESYEVLRDNATLLTPIQSCLYGILHDAREAGGWARVVEMAEVTEDTRPADSVTIKGTKYTYRDLADAGISMRMLREDMPEVERRLASAISGKAGAGKASRRAGFRTSKQTVEDDQSITLNLKSASATERRVYAERDLAILGLSLEQVTFARGFVESTGE